MMEKPISEIKYKMAAKGERQHCNSKITLANMLESKAHDKVDTNNFPN